MLSLKLTAQGEAAFGVPPSTRSGSGPPPQPGPIQDLAVGEVSATTAQLSFTPAAHAAIHEYRLDGGAWQALAGNRMVTGLTPETPYAVEVRGRNASGGGSASNMVELATTAQEVEPAAPVVTAIVMGQSELEHIFGTDSFFRQIAQPAPGDGNLIVVTQRGQGNARCGPS